MGSTPIQPTKTDTNIMTSTTTENTETVSDTVKSLFDVEHSTCSIDSFKGRPTFAINKNSPYPFSFGIPKAKLILKHVDALRNFVESDGQRLTK